jgi:hypothetical protein
MTVVPQIIETGAREGYRILLDEPDEVLISGPPSNAIEQIVAVLRDLDDPPEVQLLTREDVLNPAMDDFLVGGAAADLTAANQLAMRTGTVLPESFLFLTEESVTSIITANTRVAGFTTDDSCMVEHTFDRCTTAWEEAEEFSLRTPPISRTRETLANELSPAVRTDFDAVLRSLETARGDGDGLDSVTISLLVAAKNEALFYNLSKWGEEVGIGSRTTFSRVKRNLEELGIIDTEKVSSDIGRPRQRLILGDERFRDAETTQLASIVCELLPAANS